MIYLFMLLAFLTDRLTKSWAGAYLAEHGHTELNGLITLRETYNRGIAFGFFQGVGPIVGWLTIGVLIGLFIYMHRLPSNQHLVRIGLAILIGGALGNLVDRIFAGEVLDFIETPFQPGIFNMADVMIHLGLILLIVGTFIYRELPEETAVEESSLSDRSSL